MLSMGAFLRIFTWTFERPTAQQRLKLGLLAVKNVANSSTTG